jgi:dCTP diphosphatase
MSDSLADLTAAVDAFAAERNWEQFHSPKNLALSLMIEAAEVAEHFQWSATDAPVSSEQRDAIAMEIGDVLLYLVRLADRLGIDPVEAARAKMRINALRYPVDKAYGTSAKYDALDPD